MISSKILVPLIIGLACILALIVGSNLAVDSNQTVVYVGFGALIFTLLIFAREYWWISLFIALGFGGFANVGFKVYAHEAMLTIALLGLLPSVALRPQSPFSAHRPKLPWFYFATAIYLFLHIFYSIWANNPRGFIEIGNTIRPYVNGLWPLLFIFLFRLYGRATYLPLAIYLLQAVYFLRATMTLATIYFPKFAMMLPGLNFVLPGNTTFGGGLDDLRFPGHGICLLACAILLSSPTAMQKLLQYSLIVFALFISLLSGGRGLLVATVVAILATAFAARLWKLLAVAGVGAASLILFLNLFPTSIYVLDIRMQRALSVLILDFGATQTHELNVWSNIWHERIQREGYDRWTSSSQTFLIGTGIKPWIQSTLRETNPYLAMDAMVKSAANVGNYESSLWAILAPVGLIGFLLYVSVLGYFGVSNARYLYRTRHPDWGRTIAFLGCYPALEWLLFSPVMGGYPALETLFASAAFYYLSDMRVPGIVPIQSRDEEEHSVYSSEAD